MAVQTPIRGLRSFCVAAKCLSFKHAAAQLYLTPSAISHQIRLLEQQIDKQLFLRQTRAIELTEDGKLFYKKVAPIIEQLETTITEFTNSGSLSTISITLPEFFSSEVFVPRLNEWSDKHPNINLQLETVKNRTQASKETNLSIVLASTKPADAIVYELFPISYMPACSPDLFKKLKPFGKDALNQAPLIVHQSRPWAWHQWAEENDIEEFSPKRIVQVDSMFSVARAAQQGIGVALIPLPLSQNWFDEGVIYPLFDQQLKTRDKYYLIQHDWHASREDLDIFVQWLLSEFSM
ncbi:LysR family transcriptional regulator [Psychrosphaera saromensis]|uniref:LysR family transcriptional regulator n=1 Tax=Psychrosphaera saromensis TaxID=716813 RepID=A0A2S7UWL2_9GAMM|nr:LysR substrate-binding domain-containing protein [Psychrosphaera saromensis]PQJ53660.1 LysR family transcriptional regulator [Psychrosphaera saromensis]GHB63430.1 LysR family transcriptional regulator [Psychrosphaera saromensis]GLQ15569.1 LysR family transcriptional regulator [Psychrosphaera saromensis]